VRGRSLVQGRHGQRTNRVLGGPSHPPARLSDVNKHENVNFQGADLGRAASEGVLCGPGAIELPG